MMTIWAFRSRTCWRTSQPGIQNNNKIYYNLIIFTIFDEILMEIDDLSVESDRKSTFLYKNLNQNLILLDPCSQRNTFDESRHWIRIQLTSFFIRSTMIDVENLKLRPHFLKGKFDFVGDHYIEEQIVRLYDFWCKTIEILSNSNVHLQNLMFSLNKFLFASFLCDWHGTPFAARTPFTAETLLYLRYTLQHIYCRQRPQQK